MRTPEYRRPPQEKFRRGPGEAIVLLVMVAAVVAMRPDDDHALVAGSDHHNGHAVIVVRTVSVVSGGRVSMVVRPPNHDLTVEVGIAEAERNPDARLGLRDASREAE